MAYLRMGITGGPVGACMRMIEAAGGDPPRPCRPWRPWRHLVVYPAPRGTFRDAAVPERSVVFEVPLWPGPVSDPTVPAAAAGCGVRGTSAGRRLRLVGPRESDCQLLHTYGGGAIRPLDVPKVDVSGAGVSPAGLDPGALLHRSGHLRRRPLGHHLRKRPDDQFGRLTELLCRLTAASSATHREPRGGCRLSA